MANYQLIRSVSSYEAYFGHRVSTRLIRIGRTMNGEELEAALLNAVATGIPLPELAEKARLAPATGQARCRLRQKRYRLVPGKRG